MTPLDLFDGPRVTKPKLSQILRGSILDGTEIAAMLTYAQSIVSECGAVAQMDRAAVS